MSKEFLQLIREMNDNDFRPFAERLYTCADCARRIRRNGERVLPLREIENSSDYECDVCGRDALLFEVLVSVTD